MAVSQTLTLTETSISQSANQSTVRILWQSTQTGDSWNGYTRTAKYYVSINGGAETEYSVSYTLPQNSTQTIVDTRITVPHKDDGTGTVTVRTWMDTSISAGVVTRSKTLSLTTIQRETIVSSVVAGWAMFDAFIRCQYFPQSASFYHRLYVYIIRDGVSILVKEVSIAPRADNTYGFKFSDSELATVYSALPNYKKGVLRFLIRTYSDSGYTKQIGDGDYKEITLSIPTDSSAVQPTATMTVSPVSSMPTPLNTLYIKGRSKVDVNFTNGEGKYGATITSYTMRVESKDYGSPYTSGYLSTLGNVAVTGTVTDSRGISRTYTETITVLDYGVPQILPTSGESEVVAARCDSNGNLSETGTYLKIKAKRNYSKVISSGVQKNFCLIRYRYKAEVGSYSSWTTILANDASSDEVVTGALLGGALSVKSSYIVQVQAVDTMGETATTTITIPTERVYMHKAGSIHSIGFGKYVEEENTIDIADDIAVKVRGGLELQGSEIADFVVAQGMVGDWYVRKWYSGYAECWYKRNADVNVDATWGTALYYGTVAATYYPFTFAEIPSCQITCEYGDDNTSLFLATSGSSSTGRTPTVMLCRTDAQLVNVNIQYYAMGKWK